jgi:ATP-dependent protease ClpP protease subunit
MEAYSDEAAQQVILLSGEIVAGDAGRLTMLLEAAIQAGRPLPDVSLNSGGGLFLEGIRLAEIVKRHGLTTYVEEGATCASACFLVFAAGKEKIASYSGRIGVHSAKDAEGNATRASAATSVMSVLLRSLGVPPTIIKKMATTPHERIAWLSTPELQSMQVKPLGFSDPAPLERVLQAVVERGPPRGLPEPEMVWLWDRLVRAASRLSVRQGNGRAQIINTCPPEARSCSSSVSYTIRGDQTVTLRTTRERTGRVMAREVCGDQATNAQQCRPWASASVDARHRY